MAELISSRKLEFDEINWKIEVDFNGGKKREIFVD